MKSYQFKVIIKNTKPPIWKRCLVPAGITFAQLSVILQEIMELPGSDQYEFEFFQRKVHLREWRGEEDSVTRYDFDYMCASDTFIDGLVDEEKWFTLRVQGEAEYRVTIEKCLEGADAHYPVILKQKEHTEIQRWTDIAKWNSYLEDVFCVSYGKADYRTYTEIVEELKNGGSGLCGSYEAISREEHNKKSPATGLKELASMLVEKYTNDITQKVYAQMVDEKTGKFTYDENIALNLLYEAQTEMRKELPEKLLDIKMEENTSRKATVKGYLMAYGKEDLKEIAKEIHLLRYKNLKKEELAEKIRNEILQPDTMRRRLLLLDEDEMEAFDEAVQRGCCYRPREDILDKLETLYDLNYIAIYLDDYVEVPAEVAEVYQKINTPEYRLARKRVSWMYKCLRIVEMLYVVAPVKIVYRIYRRHSGCKVSREEFLKIFAQVPEDVNPCVVREDRVIYKEVLKENLYLELEQQQEGKEFYIPTEEEIKDYAANRYPSEDLYYQRVEQFLQKELQLDEDYAKELMPMFWNTISMGYGFSDVMDILNEREIIFPSSVAAEQFAKMLMDANNHTRMWIHRGQTPVEIGSKRRRYAGSSKPTIVPVSSMAADMLREAQDELDRRGISVDYDYGADEIPVMLIPEGTAGEKVVSSKKIYPNDPCPCGSGKKYKKCCGRK